MHDPTKVVLGQTGSSDRDETDEPGYPKDFPAGIAVRRSASGCLQIPADGTAQLIGITLSGSYRECDKTRVVRKGTFIPLRLIDVPATKEIGDVTFTSKIYGAAGNLISIEIVDELFNGAAEVFTDADEPNKIVVHIESGITSAATIAAAIEADQYADALVSCSVEESDAENPQDPASETFLEDGEDVAVVGQPVKLDEETGQASIDGVLTGAVFLSGALTGLYPDGTTAPCAYVQMQGGL